ncbi:MAG: bifunctional riboflavin kinase/FAD synthetase [Chloroflexota bacterium]|nr:bifunctional riboflavin kinase/FAD synthetase [Chloroflexota bacterium]
MQVVTDLAALERGRPAILTIGAFDGVHRGHQYLIRQVVDRARRLEYDSVVVTFDPRPSVVLRPGSMQLTDGAEKARIISALGPRTMVILPFSPELAAIPAGQFLVSILDHVNLAEIWVGADFAFGHKREGNVDFLIRSGQNSGFAVHVVARQSLGGHAISSTAIRQDVTEGDISTAARLLGHYLRLAGTVVRGAGRGHDLGFPTANLRLPPAQLLPGAGIYAANLHALGSTYSAAVSVGYNVQFDGQEIVVEAHALDFSGDLRGQPVALDLVARLRDEQRFPNVDALVEAMGKDVAQTRLILAGAEEPGELILPV